MKILIFITFILLSQIFANSDIKSDEVLILKMREPSRSLIDKDLDVTKEYKYQLIDLILSKTVSTHGAYKIENVPTAGQNRIYELLDSGIYNIFITMTSKEREEKLLPIKIPAFKGMYGYRIFLIRKGEQKVFDNIKNENDLKKLWLGQGSDWPDYKILKYNGYQVVGSHSWLTLYGMLENKRFDFFPRGIHEPWKELKANPDKNLEIEKNLMIHYPAPGYIFVSKKNKKLAQRLKQGLEIAIKDGSFDKLFYNHPDIKTVLEKSNFTKRRVFKLTNPLLPENTPLNNKSLWLDKKDKAFLGK